MRTRVPLLLLCATLSAGCFAPHPYIVGTVSYTAASPTSSTSGALPLRAIACAAGNVGYLRLGERCLLRGPLEVGPRGASVTGKLMSDGACTLPGNEGERLSLPSAAATYQSVGSAVDTTVGGMMDDGRYVTWRFTGTPERGAKDVCKGVVPEVAQAPTDGTSLIGPGREAWETWVPEAGKR